MKIWKESPNHWWTREGLIPWMSGMVSCMQIHTQTHPSPHSCAEKCEWDSGSWRWSGILPSTLSHLCLFHLLLFWSSALPTQQTQALQANTHIHTCFFPSHTCCLLILPARIHTPLQTSHAHVAEAGVWWEVTPPPHTHNAADHLMSGFSQSGKNYPRWHLGTKASSWEARANTV